MKSINFIVRLSLVSGIFFNFYSGRVYGNDLSANGKSQCLETNDDVRYLVSGIPAISFVGSFPDRDSADNEYYCAAFEEFLINELVNNNAKFSIDTQKKISADTIQKDSITKIIKEYNCNRCIIPIECSIIKRVYKKTGWRDGKYGLSYERPEKTIVATKIILKVVNAEGETIVQQVGEGNCRQPFMYGFFKRFTRKNTATSLAESLYGPPILKSLYKAVASFCIIQSSER